MRTWMIVVAVAVAVAVLAAVAIVVFVRRRRTPAVTAVDEPASPPPDLPVSGLEAALDQVADRSGRSIAAGDDSTGPIDRLRESDDSGPMLRRALDLVSGDERADIDDTR